MKTRLLTPALLAVILVAPVTAFAGKTIDPTRADPPVAYNVSAAGPYVERGTPLIGVVAKLGQPAQRLSREVWVYRGFAPTRRVRVPRSCTMLVVTFTDGIVTDLKLANASATAVIAANLPGRPAAQVTVLE